MSAFPVRAPVADSPAHLRRLRLTLPDGSCTTAHVTVLDLARTRVRVVRLPALTPLASWCAANGVADALVGGFYVRAARPEPSDVLDGIPLGELRVGGQALTTMPFLAPWCDVRACLHVDGPAVRIARRDALPDAPAGDLLQAGPLLVRDGEVVDADHEGFSAGAAQFDSDITDGRHPRAAIGTDGERIFALACDGRATDEAGLSIPELARAMRELGARDALNLDGGGSTSLVCGGTLRNVPREGIDRPLPGGRAIATAIVFDAVP